MGVCMKTTVDISDSLLKEAKKIAAKKKTSVRSLIEQGLRQTIEKYKEPQTFRLRKATFKGKGLHPSVEEYSWEKVRDLVYEGHGG